MPLQLKPEIRYLKLTADSLAVLFALLLPSVASWAGALERAINGMSSVVDLTYPLNGRTPTWPGDDPFQLERTADYEQGHFTNRFSTPEHLGTHVDAPAHFVKGAATVDGIPLGQLIGQAIVVDLSKKALTSPDSLLTVQDLFAWERKYGKIPKGAFVLMRTGWGKRWNDPASYLNKDEKGVMRFPGFSREAAEFLVRSRDVKGIGTDTLSVDPGSSSDFVVHHLLLASGRLIIECLANLDKLPPKGSKLIVAPLSIQGGSGAPARVLAILP